MAEFHDALFWVQKQYFQALGMKYFDWEKLKIVGNGDSNNEQKALLNATVFHPLSKKYPPSNAYKLSFLKSVLAMLEDQGLEVCDELYSLIADLMSKKNDSQDYFSYKSYILPCGYAVTLCESVQFVSQGTTGLNTWQAGLYLSNWLIENKFVLEGKKVLELGCGVGLTGLIALHCSRPEMYIFTDCHEKVLDKVKENLQIHGFCLTKKMSEAWKWSSAKELNSQLFVNEISKDDEKEICFEGKTSEELRCSLGFQSFEECTTCSVSEKNVTGLCNAVVCQLDWERYTSEEIIRYNPDIILASDVIFDPKLIEPLVNVIKAFLSHEGQNHKPVAYVASTIRNKETYEKFLLVLEKSGIQQDQILPAPKNFTILDTTSEIVLLRLKLP